MDSPPSPHAEEGTIVALWGALKVKVKGFDKRRRVLREGGRLGDGDSCGHDGVGFPAHYADVYGVVRRSVCRFPTMRGRSFGMRWAWDAVTDRWVYRGGTDLNSARKTSTAASVRPVEAVARCD